MSIVREYYMAILDFPILGTITTGNGKWKWKIPDDGEILAYGGYIKTLGTGAASYTQLQLRNETTTPDRDYFLTRPTFEVDSATNLLEGGELIGSPTFRADEILVADVDAIVGGSNSADATFWILVGMHREVNP